VSLGRRAWLITKHVSQGWLEAPQEVRNGAAVCDCPPWSLRGCERIREGRREQRRRNIGVTRSEGK
jgi:hypothetical protein